MPDEAPQPQTEQAKPFPEVDFGPPPPRPGAENGSMAKMAAFIEQIMAAHAGGYNSPCAVEIEDGEGGTEIQQTTPAQIMSDLCESIWELEDSVRRLTKAVRRNTDATTEIAGDPDDEPRRKKRR